MVTGQQVHLWYAPDRLWYWRFRDTEDQDDEHSMRSSRGYLRREEAVRAAAVAYPGLPIVDLTGDAGGRVSRGIRRGLRTAGLLVVLLLVVRVLWAASHRVDRDPRADGGR